MPPRPEFLTVLPDSIPDRLKALPQWVLWRYDPKDDNWAKVPYRPDGTSKARSSDPATWGSFPAAMASYSAGGWAGVGFMFAEGGGLVGVDLDDCLTSSGLIRHAKMVLAALDSYSEVSPSGTGVKCLVRARKPEARCAFRGQEGTPSAECYERSRFFCITGRRLRWLPSQVMPAQHALEVLFGENFLVPKPQRAIARWEPPPRSLARDAEKRALSYLAKCPPAISGSGGHNTTFRVACLLTHGFGLSEATALGLLCEYNRRCRPEWSLRELRHKVAQALEKGTYRDMR